MSLTCSLLCDLPQSSHPRAFLYLVTLATCTTQLHMSTAIHSLKGQTLLEFNERFLFGKKKRVKRADMDYDMSPVSR